MQFIMVRGIKLSKAAWSNIKKQLPPKPDTPRPDYCQICNQESTLKNI